MTLIPYKKEVKRLDLQVTTNSIVQKVFSL